jgi:hypothetical protein
MVYQVPGTSEHKKTLMFWHKQKSAPNSKKKERKKAALAPRSEACSLTTTLGHNPPSPPSPHNCLLVGRGWKLDEHEMFVL